METKICTSCGIKYPATNEYFNKAKTCKGGLNTKCKGCTRERVRKGYSSGKYGSKKGEEKYGGLNLSLINLDKCKKYKIKRRKNDKGEYEDHLVGNLIQETKDHVTLRHKLGYCESFRKIDLLIGDYKVEEVRK